MAKLREARKKEIEALTSQIKNLQVALEHLKAHPEEQHQAIRPFAYAHQVLDRHVHAQRAQDLARKRFTHTFRSWTIPQQLYEAYVEPRVSNDADSRRSAFNWLTHQQSLQHVRRGRAMEVQTGKRR
ncbi:hypothetical protein AC1031_016794 [Aphanomyces cochlioides]|nr:hypothetical protein AC1031_016794 [Aphanomyces cochlioides]